MSLWTDLLLVRRLRQIRVGVVITTRPSLNILGSLLSRPGVAVIGQEHINFAHRPPVFQSAIRRHCGGLDALVTLTETDRRRYRAALPAGGRVEAIPNGVPTMAGPVSDLSGKVVLGAGRLAGQKGFDLLIRAFRKIAPQEPEWTTRICGSGPRHAPLQRRIPQMGNAESLRLHIWSGHLLWHRIPTS
jgi:glycosyltransferase involved in cell wall biosynthesis